ncbi:BBP7 family outer membrane beta-barrel protein, partial [uncultured Caulobacter sp.]|uniref:BBP7 family outer membrane beta-barrel protein n=1 Tax=uncultured Caulobacter sp. TaxID=158749 RepID=UPI002625B372
GHPYVKSGIDVACWDILGKARDRPVHALWGGRVRDRLRAYTYLYPEPGEDPETRSGGLLAQDSNIGNYERNELSVLPQLGVTLGYKLTERLKLTGGYTFVYWSNVVRPGDQIDPEVNPGNLPFANPPDADGLRTPAAGLQELLPGIDAGAALLLVRSETR